MKIYLVAFLMQYGVDTARLQGLATRGISDEELANIANELERTMLTRDADFTTPTLSSLIKNGVIYISYQSSKNEISKLAERIALIANELEPKPGLLIVIEHEYIEVYD